MRNHPTNPDNPNPNPHASTIQYRDQKNSSGPCTLSSDGEQGGDKSVTERRQLPFLYLNAAGWVWNVRVSPNSHRTVTFRRS